MSLATSELRDLTFLARFQHIWTSLRRYQVREGLGWSFLACALGLALLTLADYRLELPWNTRAVGLVGVLVATLIMFWSRVISPLRWWTRRRTATEIESRFPQLGQRIRTVVQYAGLTETSLHAEGVTPSLVDALEEDTEIQAEPLPLDRIVPWRRVWAIAALAALPALMLIDRHDDRSGVAHRAQRALLSRRPYTTLTVAPGNLTVEQGDDVPIVVARGGQLKPDAVSSTRSDAGQDLPSKILPITVAIAGRLTRDVVLFTRPEKQTDVDWKATRLDAPDRGDGPNHMPRLEKIKESLEYRVVAGSMSSPTYRIGVRYRSRSSPSTWTWLRPHTRVSSPAW